MHGDTRTSDDRTTNATCSFVEGEMLGFGHNLQVTKAASTGGCCANCRANSKCLSWTFHPSGSAKGTCYLHSSVGPSGKEKGIISGVPHGEVPKHPVGPPPPPKPRTCDTEFLGCFKEIVPAPGVPPIRALPHKIGTASTVLACAADCGTHGYPYAGVDRPSAVTRTTGGAGNGGGGLGNLNCYCGCGLNKAAPAVPHATNATCTEAAGEKLRITLPVFATADRKS